MAPVERTDVLTGSLEGTIRQPAARPDADPTFARALEEKVRTPAPERVPPLEQESPWVLYGRLGWIRRDTIRHG